jgi:hypothetical protein
MLEPIRLKARGLIQNAGPPGLLEESDPKGVMILLGVMCDFVRD